MEAGAPRDASGGTARCLYVFAAKGIQEFVLQGGQLRQMVGATALVDKLPGEACLGRVLEQLAVGGYQIVTRAAGAARIVFESESEARRLACVWPMLAAHLVPGLELVQACVPIANGYMDAVMEAERQLAAARQLPPRPLPEATPLVLRNPRSGEPAVRSRGTDLLDRSALMRTRERDRLRDDFPALLSSTFLLPGEAHVPDDLHDLAPEGGAGYLAVLHADGNSLGQMFAQLGGFFDQHRDFPDATAIEVHRSTSHAIEEATEHAVRRAVEAVRALRQFDEEGRWPIVPIVLAGDDLTVVLRADLALEFAEAFLCAFEEGTREGLSRVRDSLGALPGLPLPRDGLTAAAGIAYVKVKYPFVRAYALAESLVAHAKAWTKQRAEGSESPPASSLAVHRVTAASSSDEFDELLRGELCGADGTVLSLGVYQVGGHSRAGDPTLGALREAVRVAGALPRGGLRELRTELHRDVERGRKHFDRMVEVARDRASGGSEGRDLGTELERVFAALGCEPGSPVTPCSAEERGEVRRSPIADVLVTRYFARAGDRERERVEFAGGRSARTPSKPVAER